MARKLGHHRHLGWCNPGPSHSTALFPSCERGCPRQSSMETIYGQVWLHHFSMSLQSLSCYWYDIGVIEKSLILQVSKNLFSGTTSIYMTEMLVVLIWQTKPKSNCSTRLPPSKSFTLLWRHWILMMSNACGRTGISISCNLHRLLLIGVTVWKEEWDTFLFGNAVSSAQGTMVPRGILRIATKVDVCTNFTVTLICSKQTITLSQAQDATVALGEASAFRLAFASTPRRMRC